MRHIIFGGFDYAVLYEMDANAILNGIDYFVEQNPKRIGTTYLGKPIKPVEELKKENPDDILILIGSIVYKTELEEVLKNMGFQENRHYKWAIAFNGDEQCGRLWKHIEYLDRGENAISLQETENEEYTYQRLRIAAGMIEWKKIKTVLDLGAANERFRNFVPEDVKYLPVDYVKYTEDTLVMNINKYEFPKMEGNCKKQNTCIIAMGIIQYCEDWKWLLKTMTKTAGCIILGHDDFARLSREYRRTHWGRYNALFDHEIIREMQHLGFQLSQSLDFRLKTSIYKFEEIAK